MSDDSQRPIIVKRIKKHGHGAHGGAWKIAYADFVTAMMAFFLLMWLLGSTSKATLDGIAEYFKNPVKVSMSGGSGAGDASSVIQGGGKDLSRSTGQVQKSSQPVKKKTMDPAAAKAQAAKVEKEKLEALKEKLEAKIDANSFLKQFKKQLLIDITAEGLRIQIVDEKNRPMFSSGSALLQPYAKEILREIALVLNQVPNTISLSGHTDATPYSGGDRGYSNWELSADRANACRRELVGGGIEDGKILRVVGLGSAVPFDPKDVLNPINRRISVIVLNKQTEEAVRTNGGRLDVPADAVKAVANSTTSEPIIPKEAPHAAPTQPTH